MSEFRAMLRDEFPLNAVRLLIAERRGDSSVFLTDDGSWVSVPSGVEPPVGVGLVLPQGAVEAIAEAFHPRAGHQIEVDRLSESLKVERARVDRVLASLLPPEPV